MHAFASACSSQEVIAQQLEALQSGGDEDLDRCWAFVSPYGPLSDVHASSAGPRARFKWTIRREPRWRQIGGRPYAALLNLHKWELLGSLYKDENTFICRVRVFPFFPDAPFAEPQTVFQWTLSRLSDSTGMGRLGDLEGCWVVHHIEADFSGWFVAP